MEPTVDCQSIVLTILAILSAVGAIISAIAAWGAVKQAERHRREDLWRDVVADIAESRNPDAMKGVMHRKWQRYGNRIFTSDEFDQIWIDAHIESERPPPRTTATELLREWNTKPAVPKDID